MSSPPIAPTVVASGAMELTHIRYEHEPGSGVAIITLDREQARNAYSDEMVDSLCLALDRAQADAQVRCTVLTGAGTAFSAGGDLKAMRDKTGMFAGGPVELRKRYIDGIQRVPKRILAFDKPIVAAVNGAAIGAGLDLACMCDIRIASDRAKFGSTFVRVGLVPGDGGSYFLARIVGYPRALELILTARVIRADRALAIGLVSEVVPGTDVLSRAKEVAEEIATNSPLAVSLAKGATVRAWDMDARTSLELAASYQGMVQNTEDHLEAVEAMLDKRDPVFKGR